MKALDMIERDWTVSTEIRKLESRLWRRVTKESRKIILVTSPLQAEGKSTTAALVAVAAALHRSRRILIVDLDFRRPTLHTFFDAEPDASFALHLAGQGDLESVPRPTGVAGLDAVFAAVSETPDRVVNAYRLPKAIAWFRDRYDLVLVDAPALVPVADAASIIPYVDGILLTVMAGRSSKHHLARAREQILGMDGEILGLVVGNIQEAAPHYFDAGYQPYYAQTAEPVSSGAGPRDD